MILQNVLFPSTETCTEENMYFRRSPGTYYDWTQDHIDIGKKDVVEFDTYFNSFSLEKWKKYTKVDKVFLTIKMQGSLRLTLMRKERIGTEIHTEYCSEYLCKSEEVEEYTFEFQASSSIGIFCFILAGVKGKSKFFGANYNTNISENELHSVSLALDICTYKREKFVESNIRILNERFLNNEASFLFDKLEIYVSDNAGTLDKATLADTKVHIYSNKNVGGAGGFTRGIIEICRSENRKKHTHILVMDDDVRIEPESIFRTCTLLMCLKDQYIGAFIGGGMLRLDKQWFQVESGAIWNAGELLSLKNGLNLNKAEDCLLNEVEESAQYNAWWYCAFPLDIVNDTNLPMPIFIRGDDVEYGLRNTKHLILMNGICVWHEPFENKFSSFLYYYILRNRLIDNSLHNMTIPKKAFKKILKRQVCDEIRLYRYKNAYLLMQGVEDFLKGVEWLATQDGEQLHNEVMNKGYKLQYLEDMEDTISFSHTLYEASLQTQSATSFVARLINHCTLNGTYLSPKRSYNIVPTVGVVQATVYRTQVVLNYDAASKKGFVTKRSTKNARECMKRLKTLYKQLDIHYEKAVNDYHDNFRRLTSFEFWESYLEL